MESFKLETKSSTQEKHESWLATEREKGNALTQGIAIALKGQQKNTITSNLGYGAESLPSTTTSYESEI